jgi:hypothetical protein
MTVISMPDKLERLARAISRGLSRMTTAHTDWNEAVIETASALAEARGVHPSNEAFGRWCEANGFGEDILNKDDRAAYVAMGSDPDQLRTVLGKTQSRSIRLIFQNEFRLRNAEKTEPNREHSAPKSKKQSRSGKSGRARKPSRANKPDTTQVQDHIREAVQNEEPIHRSATAKEFNVSEYAVSLATAREEERKTLLAELGLISIEALKSASIKEKYIAHCRMEDKKREQEFESRVQEEVKKRIDRAFPHLQKAENEAYSTKERYQRLLKEQTKMFTEAEFELLLMCCHEDNVASIEKRKKATQLLLHKRFAMTGTEGRK